MPTSALSRREFLRATAAGVAAAVGGAVPGAARGPAGGVKGPARPNVVLILADDLGYETLGCNGGTSYRTPNLDRLAAEGMRFRHAYCAPLCSPTRVELMTGRYGFRNYIDWGVLDGKETTFGHLLRKAGYATCVSGKWQLCRFDEPANADHPRRSGFDEFCIWTWHYRGGKPSRYWDPLIWQNGSLLEGTKGRYGPDIHCDFVIDFIRRHRSGPFFVYYPMNLVHAPFVAPPGAGGSGRPAGAPGRKGGKGASGQATFAAMVAYMDRCVGRVLAELESLGLRERTVVLFTGDNGTPKGIISRMDGRAVAGGKGSMTDAGTHVPLLVRWPGKVPAGKVTDALVDFSDFFPTLAELAGAAPPAGVTLDGRSFLPVLRGEKETVRQWAYIHHGGAEAAAKRRAVRTRRWKLYADGRLYDLAADPLEKRPLAAGAGGAEAAAARKRLSAVLASLKPSAGAAGGAGGRH